MEQDSWYGGGAVSGDADGFEVTLTEDGKADSLLRVEQGRDANIEAWETLPFIQAYNRISAPSGSRILATHPWMKCGGRLCPLIYRNEVSGGSLLVIAFQGIWRWSFVEKKPEYYDRLWTNILEEYLEAQQVRPVRVVLSDGTIVLGEPVQISVNTSRGVLGAAEMPGVRIVGPDGDEFSPGEPDITEDGDSGAYSFSFRPDKVGTYLIKASAGGRESAPEYLAVNVSPVEYFSIAPDREMPERLATGTGGIAVGNGDAGSIIEELKKNISLETVRRRSTPWATTFFMIVIVSALTLEWIVRRRGGADMIRLHLSLLIVMLLVLFPLKPVSQEKQDLKEGDLFMIAQLHYGGGGDWYEDRTSMVRLQERIEKEFGISASKERKIVRIMDEDLFSYPLLFMTGHGNVVFSPEEVDRLRRYFDRGGFLWASDDYGMDEPFRREISKVFPGTEFVKIPFDHQIFQEPYLFPEGLPKIHEHAGGPPEGLAVFHEERMVVFYDFNTDIGDGLEAPTIHNDPLEIREQAFRMAVNIAFFAIAK